MPTRFRTGHSLGGGIDPGMGTICISKGRDEYLGKFREANSDEHGIDPSRTYHGSPGEPGIGAKFWEVISDERGIDPIPIPRLRDAMSEEVEREVKSQLLHALLQLNSGKTGGIGDGSMPVEWCVVGGDLGGAARLADATLAQEHAAELESRLEAEEISNAEVAVGTLKLRREMALQNSGAVRANSRLLKEIRMGNAAVVTTTEQKAVTDLYEECEVDEKPIAVLGITCAAEDAAYEEEVKASTEEHVHPRTIASLNSDEAPEIEENLAQRLYLAR